MARGSRLFEFDYVLGDCVTLKCIASFRFGKVQHVTVRVGDDVFNTSGIVIDLDDEFQPLGDALNLTAQELYEEENRR